MFDLSGSSWERMMSSLQANGVTPGAAAGTSRLAGTPYEGVGSYVNSTSDVSQRYGYNPTYVNTSGADPAATLASVTNSKSNMYKQFYEPNLVNTIAKLGDTTSVTRARENAQNDFAQFEAQRQREAARYNTAGNVPRAVEASMQKTTGLVSALNAGNQVNTARVQLQDRNEALQNELINVFNGIDTSSQQGLLAAAQGQYQRDAANAAAKSAAKQGMYQTVGTVAMIAAMFL